MAKKTHFLGHPAGGRAACGKYISLDMLATTLTTNQERSTTCLACLKAMA